MVFCDSSAVAKLYLTEPESAATSTLLEKEDQVYVSELARVELLGVFHRQLREKKWTRNQFLAALAQFNLDDAGGFWTWLPLSGDILGAAAKIYTTLPETVFLRSADCLHLVTAIHHGFSEICTYDKHQELAATALGIRVRKA